MLSINVLNQEDLQKEVNAEINQLEDQSKRLCLRDHLRLEDQPKDRLEININIFQVEPVTNANLFFKR